MEDDQQRCPLIIIGTAHVNDRLAPKSSTTLDGLPRKNLVLKRLGNSRPINVQRRELVVIIELFGLIIANNICNFMLTAAVFRSDKCQSKTHHEAYQSKALTPLVPSDTCNSNSATASWSHDGQ